MLCVLLLLPSIVLAATPARIVVVGGTHGNEYTGIYCVEQLLPQLDLAPRFPSLRVESLLASPRAHAENVRFIDDDLNRQFARPSSRPNDTYEATRAAEIDSLLGPKGSDTAADVVVDLHTTTANMGCTLIVNSYSQLGLKAAAHLASTWPPSSPPLRVYLHDLSHEAAPYLSTVGKEGITIEVGPTPQGLLRADAVYTTQLAVEQILEYLELYNSGSPALPPSPPALPCYVDQGKVPWPAPEGSASSNLPGALIAPSLQDRDFAPLRKGEPMFVRPGGAVIPYDGSLGEVVYPIFVNEAAYYLAQSGRGVGLATLVEWPLE